LLFESYAWIVFSLWLVTISELLRGYNMTYLCMSQTNKFASTR